MHVVGNLEIRDHDKSTDQFRVSSNLLVVEHQEATTRNFAGHCEHILRRSDDGFIIVGSGHGHGVGMSQWGAQAMAQGGAGYRKILANFYPGTRVMEGLAR